MPPGEYVFGNGDDREVERLAILQDQFDPGTVAVLEQIGVTNGWRCLEIGPGLGSILAWLSRQAGESGRVVAADIDPRFLTGFSRPNVEIRRADVTTDDLGENAFDLAHARFVLLHLPRPELAMRAMARAVRPGGWVVTEDPVFPALVSDDEAVNRVFAAINAMYERNGVDGSFGRRAPAAMQAVGLTDIRTRTDTNVDRGGSRRARLVKMSAARTRDRLLATGKATAADLDRLNAALDDPGFWWHDFTVVTTWGRKPTG